MEKHIQLLADEGLLTITDNLIAAPDTSSHQFISLSVLANTIKQTLERFYMSVQILQHAGQNALDRKQLEEICTQLAQRVSLLHEFNTPEFSDKTVFRGFIDIMLENDVLSEGESGKLSYDNRINEANYDSKMILNRDIRQTISQITDGYS